jgi:altronate dehydratase small subunit
MKHALLANKLDNVANALDDIMQGEGIVVKAQSGEEIINAYGETKFGFKIAVKNINKGEIIIKYGCPIGMASADIRKGECVHIHNVEGNRGRGDQGGATK